MRFQCLCDVPIQDGGLKRKMDVPTQNNMADKAFVFKLAEGYLLILYVKQQNRDQSNKTGSVFTTSGLIVCQTFLNPCC